MNDSQALRVWIVMCVFTISSMIPTLVRAEEVANSDTTNGGDDIIGSGSPIVGGSTATTTNGDDDIVGSVSPITVGGSTATTTNGDDDIYVAPPITHAVTVSVSGEGTVTCDGGVICPTSLVEGEYVNFYITPKDGNMIASVLQNDTDMAGCAGNKTTCGLLTRSYMDINIVANFTPIPVQLNVVEVPPADNSSTGSSSVSPDTTSPVRSSTSRSSSSRLPIAIVPPNISTTTETPSVVPRPPIVTVTHVDEEPTPIIEVEDVQTDPIVTPVQIVDPRPAPSQTAAVGNTSIISRFWRFITSPLRSKITVSFPASSSHQLST